MAKIRGFAIRGALKYIKQSQYEGGIAAILAQLSGDTAPIFETKIRYADWYPYSAYDELLGLIDSSLGDGDLAVMDDLGGFAASHEGKTPFEFLAAMVSVEMLLKSATPLWRLYCDTGKFEAQVSEPGRGVATLRGFPGVSIGHCHMLRGWIAAMGRAAGAQSGEVVKSACVHRGDEYCEYRYRVDR